MNKFSIIAFACVLMAMTASTYASYHISNINVSVGLNPNTTAKVNETLTLVISNESLSQYSTDRAALNLTISRWQSIIGPSLVQHLINPTSGVRNFNFIPGPAIKNGSSYVAYIVMTYSVLNATSINQTAPRNFVYTFNPNIFNFEHGASGEVLSPNTTLTISMPAGSQIMSVYPLPDYPAYAFVKNYTNVTTIAWNAQEPLSKFNLKFVVKESIRDEVDKFFAAVYSKLGYFSYVIIALFIVALFAYVYIKASR